MSYSQHMEVLEASTALDKLTELRDKERLYLALIRNLLRNRNFNLLLQEGLSDKTVERKVKKNFKKYGIQTKKLRKKEDLERIIHIVKKIGIGLWDDPSTNDIAELFGIDPIQANKNWSEELGYKTSNSNS